MRYVPSASNVPSPRMVGRMNWPWPHPTARLHAVSATDRHAPSPVHRPVASGPSFGPAGLRQARRPPHAMSVTANRHANRLMTFDATILAGNLDVLPANCLQAVGNMEQFR